MTQVVEHLAELTGFRDRDVLDATLVGALRDLVKPKSVAIFRVVGEEGGKRWLTRARMTLNDPVAAADPVWADVEDLPHLGDYPSRERCLVTCQTVSVPGASWLTIFPLGTDSEVVGVLEIETALALTTEAEQLVDSILRIFRNFQGLLDYSERDTLTGLLNRKTFDEAFLKATVASAAESASLVASGEPHPDDVRRAAVVPQRHWLGVIDIDHFKMVNDNYGHLIGDEVLLLLARLMRSTFRFHDRLYRFGGEEFVVLMRCATEADAFNAFERLRANTEAYAFPQVGRLTVSIGFSEIKAADTAAAAFERADKAVYYSKGHGRNQVSSHSDLVARGELEDVKKESDIELF